MSNASDRNVVKTKDVQNFDLMRFDLLQFKIHMLRDGSPKQVSDKHSFLNEFRTNDFWNKHISDYHLFGLPSFGLTTLTHFFSFLFQISNFLLFCLQTITQVLQERVEEEHRGVLNGVQV